MKYLLPLFLFVAAPLFAQFNRVGPGSGLQMNCAGGAGWNVMMALRSGLPQPINGQCIPIDNVSIQVSNGQLIAVTAGGVTSVGLSMPSWLSVAGSPVTSSGTLAVTPATGQTSGRVIGTCNGASTFAPCALVAADLPNTIVYNTRAVNTTSPLGGGGALSADLTLSIQNAAADGSTKGAAAFTANDFDAASGVVSIDYTNGQKASGAQPGFLSAADWTTFNNKAAAGNYITGLTGDGSAAGPGSVAFTLATVNSGPGACGTSTAVCAVTTNGKGLVTAQTQTSIPDAAADGATKGIASFTANDFDATTGNISLDYTNGQKATGSVPGFLSAADWATFNGKQASGNYITALTGDVTASGPGSAAATLQPLSGISSSTANISSVGWLRLAKTDAVCWRNTNNSANLGITPLSATILAVGDCTAANASGLFMATAFYSASTNAATVGVLRQSSADQTCWRNSGNSANACFTLVTTGIIGAGTGTAGAADGGFQAAQYYGTSPFAQSGLVRMNTGDAICWRNNANSADVCLSKNSSDQFVSPAVVRSYGDIYQGTTFTGSGCGINTLVGGAMAGSFLVTAGACSVTVTMGGGFTAPNGLHCMAADQTTLTGLVTSGSTTTQATFTGTYVSGDKISFSCQAY